MNVACFTSNGDDGTELPSALELVDSVGRPFYRIDEYEAVVSPPPRRLQHIPLRGGMVHGLWLRISWVLPKRSMSVSNGVKSVGVWERSVARSSSWVHDSKTDGAPRWRCSIKRAR